ncbi:uncharacterized protein B0H18DRAFT_44891 [Fomitopsis serialis]|uniref:uncharacterized protein n=1 Tax=Fomitopsis serialis TaxID=139415 RepID=UPI002007B775|nr:uncharacterized protein B0H18DRAFT_44891 [Neoantrodia serialis]KAH9917060.1 hypothetical protein B0H18DRAFT_44891 [Neoantrodia serialis]
MHCVAVELQDLHAYSHRSTPWFGAFPLSRHFPRSECGARGPPKEAHRARVQSLNLAPMVGVERATSESMPGW